MLVYSVIIMTQNHSCNFLECFIVHSELFITVTMVLHLVEMTGQNHSPNIYENLLLKFKILLRLKVPCMKHNVIW